MLCLSVVAGGDPSECDVTEYDRGQQDEDDTETLEQLGWELASNATSRVPGNAFHVYMPQVTGIW